jgi:hypothetical protein
MTSGRLASNIVFVMAYRSNAAEAWDPQPALPISEERHQIELLPPASLNVSLLKSLTQNLRHTFAPEKFPPLQLSSRPLDLGVPLGERLRLPWFRTVFTNLGEVISPEALPPLELESVPVDTGEIISDQLSHLWFSSLLRNLADRLVPERLPKLELTSKPVENIVSETWLLMPRWSDVISTPKVFYPDKPKTASSSIVMPLPFSSATSAAAMPPRNPTEAALVRDVRRSRIRGFVWMGIAAVQVIYLIVIMISPN